MLLTYSAVRVVAGSIRRLWIEAASEAEARAFCASADAGYEGPADRPRNADPVPEAYDEKTARRLLGGVSRTSLYKMVVLGEINRVQGTRRLLITRSSIERRCR